jgi:hypothetical protein
MDDIFDAITEFLRKHNPESASMDGPSKTNIGEIGARALLNPAYAAYRREAEASGEQIMSPEEFKQFQAEGR